VTNPNPVAALPDLDEMAAHPDRVAGLPAGVVAILLPTCAAAITRYEALREVLRLRIAMAAAQANVDEGERLLGTEEIGRMVGRSKSWVEHHTADLPPRRSLLGQPVWLKRDIDKWIKALPRYGANGDG
jgi:predicted DNA-binding transcriptional regulator AlpA